MPELPEVETLRRGLERSVRGRRITEARVVNEKSLKGQAEAEFRQRVVGTTVTSVDRRGKYLLMPLAATTDTEPNGNPGAKDAPPVTLCIHLKMRGQLLLERASEEPGPYLCIRLGLAGGMDGAEAEELRFYDMWTWGEMRALTDDELAKVPGLAEMGEEPLASGWNADRLLAKLKGKRGPIKPMLLDQKVVAGVGNIYADESLFRAGIDPRRPAGSLTADEAERLVREIRAVLTEATDGGGTLSDEYVDLDGAIGRYTPRVYDRGGEP